MGLCLKSKLVGQMQDKNLFTQLEKVIFKKKKITINAKCLMHAAALTENIDSHCFTEIQNPAQKSYCTPPQVLPTGLFYNSTEFP